MKPWVQLDTARLPGGSADLRLMRRDDEFSIMLGTNELMNSRLSGSEQALAELAAEQVGQRRKPRVLIGGLGMGFTLRAALQSFGADTEIVVAELVPEVIAWAHGHLASVFNGCLSDPRVSVRAADVGNVIAEGRHGYDAILLDVDNGPEGLSRAENDKLYGVAGLRVAWAALCGGGVLAVWSSGPNPEFTRRLASSSFSVAEVKVRARAGRGAARHVIWVATKG